MQRRVILVGCGGPIGQAQAAAFAASGDEVIGLRRRPRDDPSLTACLACDADDPVAVEKAIGQVLHRHGPVQVLVYNPAVFVHGPFLDTPLADFESAWRVGVAGAAAAARAVLPGMLQAGSGSLVFVGATASRRGSAGFSAFASAKFALRALAHSLAREFQPQGIHVAHLIIDGVLRGHPRFPGAPAAEGIDPTAVAEQIRYVVSQPTSAWTHEWELRPHGGRF